MSHRMPREGDNPDAILHDDCEDCDRRARNHGLGLDQERFHRMWQRMLDVEYGQERAVYLNENEAILGASLYQVTLLHQRYPGVRSNALKAMGEFYAL